MDTKPLITHRSGGEYSTVILPDGVIETVWFDNDGSSQIVGRTYPQNKAAAAEAHIRAYEAERMENA